MKGSYLNELLGINVEHALYRKVGDWYHNLKRFPGVLFDQNGYVIIESKEEYDNHPLLQGKKELHVKGGIESMETYRRYSKHEKMLIRGIPNISESISFDESRRVQREISAILRNKSLVNHLKALYDNTCQICGLKLKLGEGIFYSEVHHIIPLGEPHNGKDSIDNMICVCPNHHTLLDYNSIVIDPKTLHKLEHSISRKSINYHNSLVK